MRFIRKNGRVIPVHEKGDAKPSRGPEAVAGAIAASGAAAKLSDQLAGKRTVFWGPMNRLNHFEQDINSGRAWKQPYAKAEEVAARYKALVGQQGIKPAGASYFRKVGDRSGRIFMKSQFPKTGKMAAVTFVSSKNTGKFDAHKLKAFHVRMGEHEFQRKFVKEKSFTAIDDMYHRPLRRELYKELPFEETNRHQLDILKGIKTQAKAIAARLFPYKIGYGGGPRQFFAMHEWKKKGLTPRHRLSNMKDALKGVRRDLNPMNTSFEHAYFTSKPISPRRIVGGPRFVRPKFKLVNLAANKPRVLGALAVVAAAGLGAAALTAAIRRARRE